MKGFESSGYQIKLNYFISNNLVFYLVDVIYTKFRQMVDKTDIVTLAFRQH